MEKYDFPEVNIHNVNETDIYITQKSELILGPKGQKQVRTAISCERRMNVDDVCSVSDSLGEEYPANANRKQMSPH
jgi:hypothetical protein